ncbi:hypothetical protein GCM10011507_34890 [Edaphobacter acidisoli]|uniref:Uncharacterized protein n=1 Tax=Edaphobacter acidisoli TaxID=2040573 RepID=A0A916WAI6_9BACT|nr:phage tail tube protein [Edaphobacter acidisoli]GGA80696.1 hypothetical protein GCM10011507_34890 [Edaphobacter acidisoli]
MAYKNSKAQAAINMLVSIGPDAPDYTGNPISITGSTTTSSASVTAVSSTVGLYAGQPISGTGIPTGTTIASIGSGTLTLSQDATATGSAVALSVVPFVPIYEMKQTPVSGQKWDVEDITNFQSGENKEWLKTLLDTGKVALQGNRVSTDPGQTLLKAAFLDQRAFMFQIIFPMAQGQTTSGDTVVFAALVEQYDETVTVGKSITVSVSLQRTGQPTYTEGS